MFDSPHADSPSVFQWPKCIAGIPITFFLKKKKLKNGIVNLEAARLSVTSIGLIFIQFYPLNLSHNFSCSCWFQPRLCSWLQHPISPLVEDMNVLAVSVFLSWGAHRFAERSTASPGSLGTCWQSHAFLESLIEPKGLAGSCQFSGHFWEALEKVSLNTKQVSWPGFLCLYLIVWGKEGTSFLGLPAGTPQGGEGQCRATAKWQGLFFLYTLTERQVLGT